MDFKAYFQTVFYEASSVDEVFSAIESVSGCYALRVTKIEKLEAAQTEARINGWKVYLVVGSNEETFWETIQLIADTQRIDITDITDITQTEGIRESKKEAIVTCFIKASDLPTIWFCDRLYNS